ncbi:MAG: HupE/UreJ family protein [Halothiobacillaceae bacterium]|nr:HupE/UreJ family protein [Halothiobacillaceae bacterium]HER35079.1 HupE/UreJ family protein [Halothiobacillaceae bacterium]
MIGRFITVLSLLAVPGLASAHVGSDPLHGSYLGGFLHPLLGVDHLLALVAIGVWLAFQEQGQQRVVMPLTLLALAMGAFIGLAGVSLPGLETVIALSVVAVGLMVGFRKRLPVWAAGIMAGGFMLFHGAAHGAEMGVNSNAFGYVVGLVSASGLVLMSGRGLGNTAQKLHQSANRIIGIALMLSGGVLVTL